MNSSSDTVQPAGPDVGLSTLGTLLPRMRSALLPRVALRVDVVAAVLASLLLFGRTLARLVYEWVTIAEAGHGPLLAGAAVWLLWKNRAPRSTVVGATSLGIGLVSAGSVLTVTSQVGVPSLTLARIGMLTVVMGLIAFWGGTDRLRQWWLPLLLLFLSLPVPGAITSTVALPLQIIASRIGATLLEARHVPTIVAGNVLRIPGHDLFVTEACSGLRSLGSLMSLAILAGGLWLRTGWGRTAVVVAAVPIAILLNGVRIFLTGFLTFFVSADAGRGFMHMSEGWLLFVVALLWLGLAAWAVASAESAAGARRVRMTS